MAPEEAYSLFLASSSWGSGTKMGLTGQCQEGRLTATEEGQGGGVARHMEPFRLLETLPWESEGGSRKDGKICLKL